MKKILLTFAVAATMLAANAQEMMSKAGTPILPEANDWSIGVGASPLINYVGNLFGKTSDNLYGSSMSPQQSLTIVGLMVKDATNAYRVRVGINFGSTTTDF